MRSDLWRAVVLIWGGGILFGVGATGACTKAEETGILKIVTQTGACVAPIVVQGILAGEPAGQIADSALACAGADIESVIAFVESLMSSDAGVGDSGLALSPVAEERLGALHAELLNRRADRATHGVAPRR